MTVTTSSEEKISVFIYDMLGKLIDKKEVRPREVPQLQIGGNYPTGIYNIIVSQGTEVKTFRVIKR